MNKIRAVVIGFAHMHVKKFACILMGRRISILLALLMFPRTLRKKRMQDIQEAGTLKTIAKSLV